MAREYCIWKAMLRFRRKSVMVVGLFVGLPPIAVQATIQLETWRPMVASRNKAPFARLFPFIEIAKSG